MTLNTLRSAGYGLAITFGAMAAMELVNRLAMGRIPNPSTVLLLACILAAWRSCVPGAVSCVAASTLYLGVTFSEPGRILAYSPDNLLRLGVSVFVLSLSALIVSRLRRDADRGLGAVRRATELEAQLAEAQLSAVEKDLDDSRRRLDLAVRASNVGLWDWDLLTDDVFYSREWKRQLGFGETEIDDRLESWAALVHPDDLAPALARARAFIECPWDDYLTEFRMRHSDGSYRWILSRADLVRDESGRAVRMLGCHVDITRHKLREAELERANGELARLATRIQGIREEEREAIARDIHDDIGQTLAALAYDVSRLRNGVLSRGPEARRLLADMADRMQGAMRRMQGIASGMRPRILDDLGLQAAVEWLASEFSRTSGIACLVSAEALEPGCRPEVATALFRIAEEALENIRRHAGASRVRITLHSEDGFLGMEIADDGRGLAPGSGADSGFGVLSMRERARALGGSFSIASLEAGGARVTVRIPLDAAGRNGPKSRSSVLHPAPVVLWADRASSHATVGGAPAVRPSGSG